MLGLVDLDFSGGQFTWSNCRHGRHLIRERLDKGLATFDWRILFSRAVIHHLLRVASNHFAFFLDTFGSKRGGPKPFLFEAFWTHDGRSTEVIKEAWAHQISGSPSFKFDQKIRVTRVKLK